MFSQTIENPERPDPIQERVGLGIFTDREQEMASLMDWVERVSQKYGRSQALVSHRRYGKTAIMERLYNRLFWEREDVMPFYFEVEEYGIWKADLIRNYFRSFLQQFLAYRTRDATLAFDRPMSFKQLYSLAQEVGETPAIDMLEYWEEAKDTLRFDEMTRVFHYLAHSIASRTGLSIIVMFDEFQRLDQLVYDDSSMTHQSAPLTGSFATAAESSRAPMLIAGSQVTVLTQRALSGAMLGRVGTKYIERLPLTGAVELVFKFAQRQNVDVSLDLAYTISRLVDGHPYYIWCIFHSEIIGGDLTTEEGIREILTFEVENRAGYINEFWRFHFSQNMEAFGSPHAKEMVLYLTQYSDSEVRVEKLVDDLALPISVEEANETLRKLVWCDLVREQGNQFYGGLSDPLLARMLRVEYSWEIEQLTRDEAIAQVQAEFAEETSNAKDEIIAKLRGELNQWVGRFAEMFIDKLMKRHFNDQRIDGTRYFNYTGEVQLSRFRSVFTTMVQPAGATRSYQIDLYGVPAEDDQRPWIVEAKNWQEPVSRPHVAHFWAAAQNLAKDRDHEEIICWFYARNGFSAPAKEFLQEKGILYTDEALLLQMIQDFQMVERWHEA